MPKLADRYPFPAPEGSHWKVPQDFDVTFNWDYDEGRATMMGLYRKGVEMQWNAETRIDWTPGARRGQSRAAARGDAADQRHGRVRGDVAARRRPRCAATSRAGRSASSCRASRAR